MFKCKKCKYKTINKSNWNRHLKSKRHILKSSSLSLSTSVKKYAISQSITNDKLKHKITNIDKNNESKCGFCNKEYATKYTLLRHMKTCKYKQEEEDINELKKQIAIKDTKIRMKNKQIKDNEKKLIENEKKLQEKLQEKDEYFKNLILNLNQTGNKAINNINYIMINYNNAPAIKPIDKYNIDLLKYTPENVSKILTHSNEGTLNKLLTDTIVDAYKTEDPNKQTFWATDIKRNNYIVREKNKDGVIKWIIDKNGEKVILNAITPMLNILKTNVRRFLQDIPNIEISDITHQMYMKRCGYITKSIQLNTLHKTLATSLAEHVFHNQT